MKTIREQFEEIWPVPEGIQWNSSVGEYLPSAGLQASETMLERCVEFDTRLDTFTRCQESQAIVTSLNEELVGALIAVTDLAADLDDDMEQMRGSCRSRQAVIEAGDLPIEINNARILIAKARG